MNALDAIILGLIQGLTEFLPISSSGHLVIGQTLLGLPGSHLVFDVAVHGATLAAVVVWFRRRLWALLQGGDLEYVGKLAVATLPVAFVGAFLGRPIETAFGSPWLVVITLSVTGLGLLSLYARREGQGAARPVIGRSAPTWRAAVIIGLAQAAAILPGISRSGSTIVAGLWLGLAPAAAAEFSFLLAIPAILGAVAYHASPLWGAAETGQGDLLLYGAGVAFASGLGAIALVLRLLERRGFRRFGFYCFAVAGAFAAWLTWAA